MPDLQLGAWLRMCSIAISRADAVTRVDLVRLASSRLNAVVRVTGGAGFMSAEEGAGVAQLLAEALGGAACQASVLAGATMVITRPQPGNCADCDHNRTYCSLHAGAAMVASRQPSVMDVLSELSRRGAPCKTVGVAPTISGPRLYGGSVIIENRPEEPHYTVLDERAPVCVLTQFNTDRPNLTWLDEALVCIDYMDLLRREGDHRSLHLVYNGGDTTRQEIEHVANLIDPVNPWEVLLVEDSGRMATQFAKNSAWRKAHPHVVSCKKHELPVVIRQMGFAPRREEGAA